MKQYTITIACDHHEGDEFCNWLNEQGHDATIGNDTGNWIDGINTDYDILANEIINDLWVEYCNQ